MKKWYSYPEIAANEPCRFCPHPASRHIEVSNFGTEDMVVRWHNCEQANYSLGCKCPGFAAKDNLRYLEQLSEEC